MFRRMKVYDYSIALEKTGVVLILYNIVKSRYSFSKQTWNALKLMYLIYILIR
ncbi:hypothetical protein LMG33818_001322 [Halomonadaceae bacterium LMG 33818]